MTPQCLRPGKSSSRHSSAIRSPAACASTSRCRSSTRLIFDQTGKVTVYNNASVNGGKKPVSIAPPGQDKPTCGQDATPEQLTNGLSIDVPDNMVIYADTVAGTSRQCYGGEIGGPTSTTKLPLGTFSSTTPATPTSAGQSYTYDVNMAEATKKCGNGNLYAEGVLKGQVTIRVVLGRRHG